MPKWKLFMRIYVNKLLSIRMVSFLGTLEMMKKINLLLNKFSKLILMTFYIFLKRVKIKKVNIIPVVSMK
jgi:hypothetical protein